MLAIAGGDSRREISTLTHDLNALHTAKVNELLNVDKIWCGGGGRQTAIATSSLDALVPKQRLDGSYNVRLVARGFEQTVSSDTDFYVGTPKLTTLRALLAIAAIYGNSVGFGEYHRAFHQSPMPSDSEPVYVEPAPEAQLDSSKVRLCQESVSGTQDLSSGLVYSQHTENQRHELQPADIRSFDVCEETCTTIR